MAQTLLFQNARLIDGIADQPRAGMSILVTGERITAVERGAVPAPPGAQVIDLGGKTVLPGLIDTHVHSTFMDSECLPLFSPPGSPVPATWAGSWRRSGSSRPNSTVE